MRKMLLVGLVLALAALPAAADVIAPGIDVWETRADGQTYTDLSFPAGFFCPASPAFSIQVGLTGVPIATNPADVLGKTDTVIQRLDPADVTNGDAIVSAIIRAISFKGTSAINVPSCPCNPWTVRVLADGTQPTSRVTIRRTSAGGGTFDSDIRINAHLIFTCGTARADMNQSITLQAAGGEWANQPGSGGVSYPSPVSIDTNGDGTADLPTPGTSGFATGWSPALKPGCSAAPCPVVVPHQVPGHAHFIYPPPRYCKSLTQQQTLRRGGKAIATNATLACAQKEISPTVQPAEPIGTLNPSGIN